MPYCGQRGCSCTASPKRRREKVQPQDDPFLKETFDLMARCGYVRIDSYGYRALRGELVQAGAPIVRAPTDREAYVDPYRGGYTAQGYQFGWLAPAWLVAASKHIGYGAGAVPFYRALCRDPALRSAWKALRALAPEDDKPRQWGAPPTPQREWCQALRAQLAHEKREARLARRAARRAARAQLAEAA